MYVLDIIPFSRTAPSEPLTYRSSKRVPLGTLIEVPLRKKVVLGLVVGILPAQEAKAELKRATFVVSKSGAKKVGALPRTLLEAAKSVAEYHATSLGAVLSTLLIPVLHEESLSFRLTDGAVFKSHAVEMPTVERRTAYGKIIRTGTTLLVVPTQTEVDEWTEFLKEFKPVVVSGKLSGKKREERIARASGRNSGSLPALIITTPSFAWLPIPHLSHIIIERTSAGGYMLPKRPYLDIRYALTALARARNISITYGDYPLPIEYRPHPDKPVSQGASARITILDTRTPDDEEHAQVERGPFRAVPKELLHDIRRTIDKGGRAAVLAVRKGYAPTVVCRDCGTTVTDEYGRNLTFSTHRGERTFRSVDGTTIEAAHTACKNCGSWNLVPIGIGIERVEEELREAFPDVPVVALDFDRTSKTLKSIRASLEQPGTIIVGTESLLPWLSVENPVELAAIASADSLLALPFWRSRERFVRVALMLAERSKRLVVATRRLEDAALSAVESPATSDFWKEETNLRKVLHYPPFGTLVVFQAEGTSARLAQARAAIREACAPHTPIELAPRHISANTLRATSVLHLPDNSWPDAALAERFASLSPAIRIHINAESLW